MPLSRLTMPKALRDSIRRDIGVDDFHGTPEQFNSDAVLPVYCTGQYKNTDVLLESPAYQLKGWTGSAANNVGIWARLAAFPQQLYSYWPSDNDVIMKLRFLRYRLYLTAAGRATLDGANARIVVQLKYGQSAVEENPDMTMMEWLHEVPAESGCEFYPEGGLFQTGGRDGNNEMDDRPSYVGISGDPRGLELWKAADTTSWHLSVFIENPDYSLRSAPASSTIAVWSYAQITRRKD